MGVWGAGRRYRGRHSGNSVSVGRGHDCAVCDCVLGLWEVDRSERLAIRCEEGDAGAHVHGWRRVLSRESVRPVGLSIQERRRARPDSRSVYRHHVRLDPRSHLDHRRELLHRLASGLRINDVVGPKGGPLLRSDHLRGYRGSGAGEPPRLRPVLFHHHLGIILPTPTFIQPTNYLAFYPAYAAIILILVGALATPFTNIKVQMPAGPFLFDPQGILGPIWPILFVAIACGAISGWHSLVSSSSSSKQLDIETDALPVGGGAMLSEGLLALGSLIAYMVLAPSFFVGRTNVTAWVAGAVVLTTPFLGGLATAVLTTVFGLVLIIYALTGQALVTRFFRLVRAETGGEGRFRVFGHKHVSTAVGLGIPRALVAVGINAVFVAVGAVLFAVGLSMAVRLFRSYRSSMAERRARAPAAADGGKRES